MSDSSSQLAAGEETRARIDTTTPHSARFWNYFVGGKDHYEEGIRQFLDVGTGLPTADNTHEVAQRAAPGARIVYVDNDPVVLAHAGALLTSTPEGRTAATWCAA